MANTGIERAHLALARSINAEFPAGDPVAPDRSDFSWSTDALGLK
jgi:hypothetical protein